MRGKCESSHVVIKIGEGKPKGKEFGFDDNFERA